MSYVETSPEPIKQAFVLDSTERRVKHEIFEQAARVAVEPTRAQLVLKDAGEPDLLPSGVAVVTKKVLVSNPAVPLRDIMVVWPDLFDKMNEEIVEPGLGLFDYLAQSICTVSSNRVRHPQAIVALRNGARSHLNIIASPRSLLSQPLQVTKRLRIGSAYPSGGSTGRTLPTYGEPCYNKDHENYDDL